MREGMNQVANEPGGTAYAWRISEPGFEMAGKTGTAQVRAYSQEEHLHGVTKNAALDWKLRDHGLFIAFAPVAQPKYACACIVEHGADGHPQVLMARDILLFTPEARSACPCRPPIRPSRRRRCRRRAGAMIIRALMPPPSARWASPTSCWK